MQPGESYGDVINKLLFQAAEEEELNSEEERMIFEGFLEIKVKKTIPHDQVMRELKVR